MSGSRHRQAPKSLTDWEREQLQRAASHPYCRHPLRITAWRWYGSSRQILRYYQPETFDHKEGWRSL